MKNRTWTLGLLLVTLAVACTPATTAAPLPPQVSPEANVVAPLVETIQPAAAVTPRGDDLVATDPATVNLASGTPTLLEFFRFT
ncbi:MAG: hypothetical protein FJZ96_05140 [Chloroflexi bacterium]|nr:hypothetical protein [Chloroflexota bacterium]